MLHADFSTGLVGRTILGGSSFGLRYRPIELGVGYLTASSNNGPSMGLAAFVLGRYAIAGSRADGIAGVSAMLVGNTSDDGEKSMNGLYHGFVGIAYQTRWRWGGMAQPFAQLRVGAARGAIVDTTPMVELRLGLSSPEKR